MKKVRLTTEQNKRLEKYLVRHHDRLLKYPFSKCAAIASNALGFTVTESHIKTRLKTNRISQLPLFEHVADLEQRLAYLETELGVR